MNESFVVLISHSEKDRRQAEYIADGLNKSGIAAINSSTNSNKISTGLSKNDALVKAKVFLLILSQNSTEDERLKDELALVYISNKPIFPVALNPFSELSSKVDSAMKLMLAKINWIFLINEESYPNTMNELVNEINAQIRNESDNQTAQIAPDKFDAFQYLNNKENKGENVSDENEIATDFWQMNFSNKDEISWGEFRTAFLKEFEDNINEKFGSDRVEWFCNLLFYDIFEQSNIVKRRDYVKFIGDKEYLNKNTFYQRLLDYGRGMLAMKEVFDMKSSVRITAVQKLGSFQTISVAAALLDLTHDYDPNIRAVSALALAKTGRKADWIINRLGNMLDDSDRLVRESACLSLGLMKSEETVSRIVDVWRNDPIKHVREAAQLALSRMGGGEADKAMKMVEVLSKEMKAK